MEVVNIVATVKLNDPLNLNYLCKKLEGAEFSSPRGNWVKFRILPKNYYIAFYKSGKFLITGIKSKKLIDEIAKYVTNLLTKNGINVKISHITIHNLIIMDSINLTITLENLVKAMNDDNVSYEPEQLPGLIYKKQSVSFLLFKSGKIIVSGVKNLEDGKNQINIFKEKIEKL